MNETFLQKWKSWWNFGKFATIFFETIMKKMSLYFCDWSNKKQIASEKMIMTQILG